MGFEDPWELRGEHARARYRAREPSGDGGGLLGPVYGPSTPLLPSGRRAGDVDPGRNQVPRLLPISCMKQTLPVYDGWHLLQHFTVEGGEFEG